MKRGRESNLGNVHKVQHDQLFYWNICLSTCSERKKRSKDWRGRGRGERKKSEMPRGRKVGK